MLGLNTLLVARMLHPKECSKGKKEAWIGSHTCGVAHGCAVRLGCARNDMKLHIYKTQTLTTSCTSQSGMLHRADTLLLVLSALALPREAAHLLRQLLQPRIETRDSSSSCHLRSSLSCCARLRATALRALWAQHQATRAPPHPLRKAPLPAVEISDGNFFEVR